MRPIKFRAWDKKIKIMLFSDDIAVDLSLKGEVHELNIYSSTLDILAYNKNDESKRYVIQQFTGLFDKNNKEIYDGDVIINANRNNGKPHKVDFILGAFVGNYGLKYDLGNENEDVEVIGNIYENPELLKET